MVTEGEIPQGSKVVEPVSWGTIILTLLAARGVVPSLINLIQSWLTRNERKSITLEMNGNKLQITGIPLEQQQLLIEDWIGKNTNSKPTP